MSARSLDTHSSSNNSQAEYDTEMNLISTDFPHQVKQGSRSSWLQTLGNQLINCFPYIRYTNSKYYCIILVEYANEPQMNTGIV